MTANRIAHCYVGTHEIETWHYTFEDGDADVYTTEWWEYVPGDGDYRQTIRDSVKVDSMIEVLRAHYTFVWKARGAWRKQLHQLLRGVGGGDRTLTSEDIEV